MAESINEQYLKGILCGVAMQCKLDDWSFNKHSFNDIAQNYFGVLIPIILNGKKNGVEVSINVVLKLAPTDERYRVSGALTLLFAREIFFYSKILPKFMENRSKLVSLTDFVVPECYYINDNYCEETIVMQNMNAQNYYSYTKDAFLNINHLLLSVKCLAQFHALSFILEHKEKDLYKDTIDMCVPLNRKTNQRFMEILKDRLNKALNVLTDSQYASLFQSLLNNCENYIEDMYLNVNRTCLCHGDIWKENLLFKYKDGQPISVCMIDFQTTRQSSPAADILYLLITSTTSELRKKHFDNLLEIYYKTFEGIVNESNLSTHEIYSNTMFKEDLKSVGPACFIIANTAIWLSSGLQQEGHVRSKIILKTDIEKESAKEGYKNRIRDIIDDLRSYSLL